MPKIRQIWQAMNRDDKTLGLIISPSWLSGLIAVTLAVAMVVGTAFSVQYQGSDLQLLRDSQTKQQQPIDNSYVQVDSTLSRNQLVSNIPLMILWGGIGCVVYIFIANISAIFRRAIDFEHELDYVHANRDKMIHEAVMRAVFRFGALAVWFLYLQITLHVLIPYIVALTYAAAGTTVRWESGAYLIMGTFLLALAIHLHVVLFRLVMLRPRVFGQGV